MGQLGQSWLFDASSAWKNRAAELIGAAVRSVVSPGGDAASSPSPIDPAFKRLVVYLLLGTRGGYNRFKIMAALRQEPMNANKIAERLELDYKTVQHHLKLLEQNGIIVTSSRGSYGAMYFLTPYMERHMVLVDEIGGRFGKT